MLSLEIQNDSDQSLFIKDKRTDNDFVSFNPSTDQTVSSNGGKADLTVCKEQLAINIMYVCTIVATI